MANNIIKHLVVDVPKTIGEKVLLLDYRPFYSYDEGIKGSQEGITCNCLSETLGYEKIDIKVFGLMQLPFEIDSKPIPVTFEETEAKLWQDWSNKGELKLSISAKAVAPVSDKRIKINGDR